MNAPNLPQASAVEVSSGANITVVGCGMGRTNAEGVDEALRSNSAAFRHASRKSDVLRTTWSAASTNTRASRSRLYASHGGNRDRGARISAHRLEDDIRVGTVMQLPSDERE